MATYRQIHTHIWDDPKVEEFSPNAKLLFIYSFSNKHRNEAGIYVITIKKMAFETSLTIEQAEVAAREIIDSHRWEYDWDNHVLWVRNALKYQSVSKYTIKAIEKDIDAISSPLVEEYKTYYSDILCPIDTLSIPSPDPEQTLPDNSNSNSNNNCIDKDNNLFSDNADQETAPAEENPRSPFKSKKQELLFDQFWDKYPKKKAKGDAEKAWMKIVPDDILFKKIIKGLDNARASPEWKKDKGQYIPYPATWLNGKRWNDEYEQPQEEGGEEKHEYPNTWGASGYNLE